MCVCARAVFDEESVVSKLVNPENKDLVAMAVGAIGPCISAPIFEEVLYRSPPVHPAAPTVARASPPVPPASPPVPSASPPVPPASPPVPPSRLAPRPSRLAASAQSPPVSFPPPSRPPPPCPPSVSPCSARVLRRGRSPLSAARPP